MVSVTGPRSVRIAGALFATNLAIFTILRVVFYLAFRHTEPPLDPHELARAFYLGLKFDARLAAIIALPVFIGLVLSRRAMTAVTAYAVAAVVLVLAIYAADFGTYAYIHERLNAGVLEFLRNPLISLHMVWESYHVVWFGAAIAAVLLLIGATSIRIVKPALPDARRGIVSQVTFGVFLLVCIYGKASRYPLRWSDAWFSRNRFVGVLAVNPPQFLFETMREKPQPLDVRVVRRLYPLVARYVGVPPDPRTLSLRRVPPLFPRTTGSPNVVLIQLESFAAFKTGAFGNRMNASPDFDALARDGILFTNYYSPSEKTARALFAVIFGIPDVSSWQATAHNPLAVDQHTIVNAFRGYDKFYLLGGSANWSNIRGMLEHNIDGLRVFEERSYQAPVVDVWGISDEDLFLAANEAFRRETKPFFAVIQTSGNHRPYTIPALTHDFARVVWNDALLRRSGFESNEELNSFRYLDHAIGLFFARARRERYFANTVFVLYGDHGTRTGAPASALQLGDLSPIVYHVPMVIYAPRFVRGGWRIDTPASHIDILPTIASFCGRPYVNQTLGIDLFDPSREADSAAFIFTTFHDPPDLALVQHGRYEVTRAQDGRRTLARAIYETSRWLLTHSAPVLP